MIQFLKSKLTYSFSILLERSISFLLLPLFTNVLLPSDYGVFGVLFSMIALMAYINTLGMENGLMNFYQRVDDKISMFSTIFWSMISVSLFFSGIILILATPISQVLFNSNDYTFHVRIASIILLFDTWVRYYQFKSIGKQNSKLYLRVSFIRGVSVISMNVLLLLFLHLGLKGVMLSYLSASICIALLVAPSIVKDVKFIFNRLLFDDILRFVFPLMWTSIFLLLLNFIDRFLITQILGTWEAGVYHAIYRMGMVLNIFILAFYMGGVPFSQEWLKKNSEDHSIFVRLNNILFFVSISIAFIFSFIIPHIVQIKLFNIQLVNEKYLDALPMVPVILMSYVFYGLYIGLNLPVLHFNRNKILALFSGIACGVNIFLNIILIPKYQVYGAAAATLIAFMILAILLFLYVRKYVNSEYPVYSYGSIILFIALLIYGWQYFGIHSILLEILVIGIFECALFVYYKKRGWFQLTLNRKAE